MITGMPRIAIAVHDFDKTVGIFRDLLGMPVIDFAESSVESLGAKLAMCVPEGGSNIELMSPAVPEAPLSQSLSRFLDGRGEGLFALMMEAPNPDLEADDLLERGLNVLPLMEGAGGRDVHPNSTHGVLVRVYPVDSFKGEAEEAGSGDLSGIERVIIAVNDLDHAVAVYGDMFALGMSAVKTDEDRGVRYAICTPPTGGLIELVSVADETRAFAASIGEFLERGKEGMYALVLKTPNLQSAIEKLISNGINVRDSTDSADVKEVDMDFGVRIRIAGK